jgi:hypothetical protein
VAQKSASGSAARHRAAVAPSLNRSDASRKREIVAMNSIILRLLRS